MANCTGCGNPLPADAVFCPQCAQRVASRTAAPATLAAAGVATISDVRTIPAAGPAGQQAALAGGEQFHGRYTIERQLGAGAMGVVYAARDQVTGRTVALKLINPALADRPSARERFVREGLMARDVRHSKIVAMYDVGEVDGQVYLVMEYLGGETLRKWLRRTLQEGRDVAFETARGIIRGVLDGLAAAHAVGVVHRDLKPENVMLTGDPHQGDYGLKILDFGIARAVGAASHVTTTSSSTGTPLYMAPEQKTAADTVGPPADLYAVTAMLYELLLGVAPEGRWGVPSRERNDLPRGIDGIIETGLANRPRSRYQSAEEYMKALDGIGTAAGTGPGPAGPSVTPPAPVPETVAAPPPQQASQWDWLKARSPAWALWERLSRKQRIVAGVIAFLALSIIVGYCEAQDVSRGFSATTDTIGSGAAGERPQGETKGPVSPPPASIAGRWSDEVTGTKVAVGYVDVVQEGSDVRGVIYDSFGNRAGTFSGTVRGTRLEYRYVADNGMTGTGRGQLTADGIHLEVEVQDNLTGNKERHTLHKNHMPYQ